MGFCGLEHSKKYLRATEKRFLIGDGAENDLVIDTFHDVLCQIGLDAAQDLRFILISIHGSISKVSLCYLVSACENHCNSLFVELWSSSPSDLHSIHSTIIKNHLLKHRVVNLFISTTSSFPLHGSFYYH